MRPQVIGQVIYPGCEEGYLHLARSCVLVMYLVIAYYVRLINRFCHYFLSFHNFRDERFLRP